MSTQNTKTALKWEWLNDAPEWLKVAFFNSGCVNKTVRGCIANGKSREETIFEVARVCFERMQEMEKAALEASILANRVRVILKE